jgi:hypothetical protein
MFHQSGDVFQQHQFTQFVTSVICANQKPPFSSTTCIFHQSLDAVRYSTNQRTSFSSICYQRNLHQSAAAL